MDAIIEQARYEIALDQFVKEHGVGAYTDTFEDLYGMEQLPGLATQRMQGKGIGFGGEGDYKTSAMNAVMWKMAEGRQGATGFMEDYTYDMADELVLGAHMLEVSPAFASTKPAIEVHPLGIGGKADPARLTFGGVTGDGIAVCMTDMGTHFRLVVANIELVAQPKPMPKLPVGQIMWKIKPSFAEGAKQWIEAGRRSPHRGLHGTDRRGYQTLCQVHRYRNRGDRVIYQQHHTDTKKHPARGVFCTGACIWYRMIPANEH